MNEMKRIRLLTIALTCLSLAALIFFLVKKAWALSAAAAVMSTLCAYLFFMVYEEEKMVSYMKERLRNAPEKTEKEESETVEQLRLALRNAEYSSLQSQINPHFLYNTLDSIRAKALIENQTEIADMAEHLAVFFRYCISNREHLVRLREELDHIHDYYLIQKFRFGDRFELEVHLEDERLMDYYIPKMTLQPIVENALHHGIEKGTRKGLVSIRVIEVSDMLEITVSDNGAGMDPLQVKEMNEKMDGAALQREKKRNGIAVSNIAARIRLTFGSDYGIRYRSVQNVGTDAVVTLPAVDDFARVRYDSRDQVL